MRFTWYIDDGYAGSRQSPHEVEIDDDELRDCASELDRLELVESVIAQDFQEVVKWFFDVPDWSELSDAEDEDA